MSVLRETVQLTGPQLSASTFARRRRSVLERTVSFPLPPAADDDLPVVRLSTDETVEEKRTTP